MAASPEESRAFLLSHREVFRGSSDKSDWMTRRELRKAVMHGSVRHWTVVIFDQETDWPSLVCPACAIGLDCLGDNWAPRLKWAEHSARSPVQQLIGDERLICPSILDAKASGVSLH
jgi:hypothetical protein